MKKIKLLFNCHKFTVMMTIIMTITITIVIIITRFSLGQFNCKIRFITIYCFCMPNQGTDTYLRLYDDSGTEVAENDDSAGSGCKKCAIINYVTSGTECQDYTLVIQIIDLI